MSKSDQPKLFSIGVVAQETGILDTTLRIWERRYGVPQPVRLASGHRRYTGEQIGWLRQVAEALSLGLRPGKVLRCSNQELKVLLAARRPGGAAGLPERWADWLRTFDRDSLQRHLRLALQDLEMVAFLDECVGPMQTAVGTKWAEGELQVRHEQFLSDIVETMLRSKRSELEARPRAASRGMIAVAAMKGERHSLGLQMFACACAAGGVGYRILGANLPLSDIVQGARETNAGAVAVTVSLASAGPTSFRRLTDLRRMLPDEIDLIVGGDGARRYRRSPAGTQVLHSIADAQRWLRSLRRTVDQGAHGESA